MIELLSKIIKNKKDERNFYGTLCSTTGIGLNIFLFVLKFVIGTVSGALSVTADGLNNLSDSGSSLITVLGFKLADRKPDPKHPFGHGRIEYMSGLAVSILITVMGIEALKSGISAIKNPETPEIKAVVFISLVISILVKIYMFLYNRKYGRKYNSGAMLATATDSLTDCISTTVVIICMAVTAFTGINIDGYCSSAVALLIIYAGIKSAYETIQPLLGQPPEPEFVNSIRDIVMNHDLILGIHDLIVHDYGPGRQMISLHAEVPADGNILEMHDLIDNIEVELFDKLNAFAVIHMDPIENKDEETLYIKDKIKSIISDIDTNLKFHDFRIVKGNTHTNLIFDVIIPHNYKYSDIEIIEMINRKVTEISDKYRCVINIDRDFNNGNF